jgi:hypothetical protein
MARIVVTEVTGTRGGRVAVAGWSLDGSGMVRPIPPDGADWAPADAGAHLFQPGNILALVPAGRPSGRDLPFRREDMVVAETPRRVGEMAKDELAAALQPGLAPGLVEGFEGWLELGRYVRAGTDCPSLAGIRVAARRLGFEERRPAGQLRLWLYDAQGTRFNLPVAARWLKQVQRTSGLVSLAALATGASSMVVRVGLADPLPDTRAYALVSNVIFF